MTTTRRPRGQFESFADLNDIPGFEKALNAYAETMTECLAEVTASFKTAPKHNGVPPVKEIMAKYEYQLSDMYGKLLELYRNHDA